jgi:hypothetical protein
MLENASSENLLISEEKEQNQNNQDDNQNSLNDVQDLPISIGENNTESESLTRTSFRNYKFNRINIPSFLIKQMPLNEKCKLLDYLCCCWIFCDRNNRIENIEMQHLEIFQDLKNSLSSNYNQNEQTHEASLQYLYLLVIKTDLNNNLIHNQWKTIGFNTDNPRNEFNEGGYLALLFINNFIKQYDEEFIIMTTQMNTLVFNFAMNSILVAYYTKLALNIVNTENEEKYEIERKENRIKVVTISQFITFTNKQASNHCFIYNLMAKILIELFRRYSKQKKLNKKAQPVTIDSVLVRDTFNRLFYEELLSEDNIGDMESEKSF